MNTKKEEELEERVTRLANFVFGSDTIYFDIKKRMASRARRINVTDGILLELKKNNSRIWIVEYSFSDGLIWVSIAELCDHPDCLTCEYVSKGCMTTRAIYERNKKAFIDNASKIAEERERKLIKIDTKKVVQDLIFIVVFNLTLKPVFLRRE